MDARLYLQPPRPAGVILAAPTVAFNVFNNDSVLILDLSNSEQSLPGAVQCGAGAMPEAIIKAQQKAMDEATPDDASTCLLLYESEERGVSAAEALLAEAIPTCRRVYCTSREAFAKEYGFLFVPFDDLGSYPSEIVAGQLYLGSARQANTRSIGDLGITHVVSIIERKLPPPVGCEHLHCNIPDADDADLAKVLREALPFIEGALAGRGKVLVHCEAGASRSVSVVCAHLMRASGGALKLADALDRVKALRPCAQPNTGFLTQLAHFDVVQVPSGAPNSGAHARLAEGCADHEEAGSNRKCARHEPIRETDRR